MTKIIKRTLLITCLSFYSGFVSADEDKFAAVKDTIQICVVCHGEAGASKQPVYPILAGQHLYYIYTQMKDFKSGLRENAIMAPLVSALEKDQMLLIAEYFSKQKWPKNKHKSIKESKKIARKVIDAGQCVQCHLGGFEGNSRVPRLAGQFSEYLNKTMLDFKTKNRKNSPAKGSLLATFSEEEIRAVADYLAGLK